MGNLSKFPLAAQLSAQLSTQPGAAGTYAIKVQGLAAQSAYSVTATIAASPVQCGPGTHAQNGACVVDGLGCAGEL